MWLCTVGLSPRLDFVLAHWDWVRECSFGKDWSVLFVFSAGILPCGDIAALVYLWNPFTIVCCVGLSTSPIENLAVILALNGAVTRKKTMILAYSFLACYTYVYYLCRTSSFGGFWFSHGHTFISLSCNSYNSCMYHFRALCVSCFLK